MSRSPRGPIIPEDERTSLMIMTAFEEAGKIMAERGLSQAEIAEQFARHLIFKIWDLSILPDDRRSTYRDTVVSYISRQTDMEMDGWGEAPLPHPTASTRDLVTEAERAAHLAGLAAFPVVPSSAGEVWAFVEIGPKTKELVRMLSASALGSFDPITGTYVVTASELADGVPAQVVDQQRVTDAFMGSIRAKGFVIGSRVVLPDDVA